MKNEIRQMESLSDAETQVLFGWGENIFGVLAHQLEWRPKELHFVLHSDGQPVSHAGVLRHVVKVNGNPVTVGGVGGVVTVPEAQRKGFARRLMQHAAKFLHWEWKVDAGLLFCLPSMVAYYGNLGWLELKDEVLIEQQNGRIVSTLKVMVLPLRESSWPSGTVELQSLPW
jgi:GNAT superfamily N-acetyltransferase